MELIQTCRYPPKNGRPYFASHFIMGGEKFDSPTPESFLFGENSDLNYLGSKPVSFPYPPPAANEPTKTLKSHINIRSDIRVRLCMQPCTLNSSCKLDLVRIRTQTYFSAIWLLLPKRPNAMR